MSGERQDSVSNKSNIDQTLKFVGLRSDNEVGHKSLLQNRKKLSVHQVWVLLKVWERALLDGEIFIFEVLFQIT